MYQLKQHEVQLSILSIFSYFRVTLIFFFLDLLNFVCVNVFLHLCVFRESLQPTESEKGIRSLELKLQVAVSCFQMLGTEPGLSARAASALKP